MAKVQVEYRYYLQAGRQQSTYKTIAEKAEDIATEFFGNEKHEVVCSVTGKPENFTVECVARATVEVN